MREQKLGAHRDGRVRIEEEAGEFTALVNSSVQTPEHLTGLEKLRLEGEFSSGPKNRKFVGTGDREAGEDVQA